MDLTELVTLVKEHAEEAEKAFNAGHHDRAKGLLIRQTKHVDQFFAQNPKPAEDILEDPKSEKHEKASKETPERVLGENTAALGGAQAAALPATQFVPPGEKPTQ